MGGFLMVFLGAGLGGALRHGVNLGAVRFLGVSFPWGTLAVNVAGSFLMGVLVQWFALKADPGEPWRLFLTTGLLGGFTTFSAFSLDAALLFQRGETALALLYAAVSVAASIGALFLGLLLVRQFA
jgi:CrcB protein